MLLHWPVEDSTDMVCWPIDLLAPRSRDRSEQIAERVMRHHWGCPATVLVDAVVDVVHDLVGYAIYTSGVGALDYAGLTLWRTDRLPQGPGVLASLHDRRRYSAGMIAPPTHAWAHDHWLADAEQIARTAGGYVGARPDDDAGGKTLQVWIPQPPRTTAVPAVLNLR